MSKSGESLLDALTPSGVGASVKGVQQEDVRGIVHEAKF